MLMTLEAAEPIRADLRNRVAKGAALLTRIDDRWFERISFDRLDLDSRCRCILGQLHGEYEDGIRRLFAGVDPYSDHGPAIAHGFMMERDILNYSVRMRLVAELTGAWIAEILWLREA